MRPVTTTQFTLRVPTSTLKRIDSLANDAGLTRAQMLRMLLYRASEAELPPSLIENAEHLRAARGIAE